MAKKLLCIALVVTLCLTCALSFVACNDDDDSVNTNPVVRITLSNNRIITLELYPEIAPISVENFLKYVDDGFYDGTFFHRIVKNFVIQGGGYYFENGNLKTKTPTYDSIHGEFKANGYENALAFENGVIGMARTSDSNDSATSQFFICTGLTALNKASLDGNYAAFGKVINTASMTVVDNIAAVTVTTRDSTLANFPSVPDGVTIISIKRVTA